MESIPIDWQTTYVTDSASSSEFALSFPEQRVLLSL